MLDPFIGTVLDGPLDDVRSMIDAGEDVNEVRDGFTPLSLSVSASSDVVQLLLQHGANVEGRYRDGELEGTALHMLCSLSGSDVFPPCAFENLDILLSHGANVNARDQDGRTPLHKAIKHEDFSRKLIQNGADVNLADSNGYTPLMAASREANSSGVTFLLQNGADVNAKASGDYGETPLHVVCTCEFEHDYTFCARILLEHDADLNATIDSGFARGFTPLDWALHIGETPLALILLEAGGKQLLARHGVHPHLWAYLLGRINLVNDPSGRSVFYSLLRENPDLFSFTQTRKRKRPDRFVSEK